MHGLEQRDGDRLVDWGRTSRDYATWRPDYPAEFYDRLSEVGIGRPGQRLLDLGTGVGFLARELARRGAIVTGIDVSRGQIATARAAAEAEGLEVELRQAPAEDTGGADGEFDAATASQCWLYFDLERVLTELRRVLKPDGLLATSHFCWLPREDEVARASEALVLRHNPSWSLADWSGEVPQVPAWAEGRGSLVDSFVFDVDVPFTRTSWRGRLRACRGVGAVLTPEQVAAFDREHDQLLRARGLEEFTVLHRIDCHVLRLPRP